MTSSCSYIPCFSASLPKLVSSTYFPSCFNPSSANLCYGTSFQRAGIIHAKFDKFQDQEQNLQDGSSQFSSSESLVQLVSEVKEEDDSCLPSDLEGAVRQSGQASATFISSGGTRAIAELLIPKLQSLDDEGAQAELWDLSRIFLETLIEETGNQRVKAIYPDAGAAALLKYRWKDADFGFASLGDRKPVQKEDEIVVMVVPDYQMLEFVQKIASELSGESPRPLIMWNPRLVSEDVGVGINVRRLRKSFLSTFSVVYSIRPFPTGAVFRCYPGLWKVFYDDKDRPNRYLLAKEYITRPDAEDLEIIFGQIEEKSQKGVSLFDQAAGVFSSLNRFMRIISR